MAEHLPLESMMDSTLMGVYITDRNGKYIYANAGFLKMSCGDVTDIPKMNVFNMVKEGFVKQSAALTAFEQKKQITMINRVNNQKGYFYNQLITATPLFDENGEVEFMVVEMLNLQTLENALNRFYVSGQEQPAGGGGDFYADEPLSDIVAGSEAMLRLKALAEDIAPLDTTVLLTGETGTGKDVIARHIHMHSEQRDHKMVEINCAALPETLLEAELFGYEKGAYTGAANTGKVGLLKQADGGTLFLDEINSMPLAVQGKLLRVLGDGRIRKLGGLEEEKVNFRLIAATNQDLEQCIKNKTFREDLYYRLAIVPFRIPPLRERKADIIPLALNFLDEYCRKYKRTKILTERAIDELLTYEWPGNVRELKNVIERIVVTTASTVVEIQHVAIGFLDGSLDMAAPQKLTPSAWMMDWESYYHLNPRDASLKGYLEYCESRALESVFSKGVSTREAGKIFKVDQSGIVRKRQKFQ